MNRVHAPWEAGSERAPQVVALGVALALTAVFLDVWLVGQLTLFFDLCFVALCLGLAALVRRDGFFVMALLPPLLMVAVFGFVSLVARDAVADPRDNLVQAVVSGVATHGVALFAGYVLCLAWLAWRIRSESAGRDESPGTSGTPAPGSTRSFT